MVEDQPMNILKINGFTIYVQSDNETLSENSEDPKHESI